MIPVFFMIFVVIVLWVTRGRRRSDRLRKEATERFWEKEQRANLTRKKDLSDLDYITIPVDSLPFPETGKEEVTDLQKLILHLSTQKIVNFTGLTNTDLKLMYGAPNLNLLMEYDKNYLELVRTLYRYGKYLHELGRKEEAKIVLEYGISIKTDVSANYTLLAEIYKEENAKERIDFVISEAEKLTSMTKKALLANLMAIRDSAVGEN
ncbi:MAG: hypothetical protein E7260_03890 [Lachnospiraceae bacterium]|nr:hypothetical protein [Lachnospiraceae bacterium]